MAKHTTIWKSYGMYSLKEMKEYEEQAKLNNDFTEEQITQKVYEDIDMSFEDERSNLFKILDGRILCIADIGLWDGRIAGCKILGNNLNEILTTGIGCDEKEVYCDAYNVYAEGYHHDGRNYVEFREIREDRNIENLIDKIHSEQGATRREINYYTKSLRPYIKEIYFGH